MLKMFVALAIIVISQTASADPVVFPSPKLEPGRFVYTVPANFVPNMTGKAGLEKINDELKKLHYPYFVVLVDNVDGLSDAVASKALNALAEDWQANQSELYNPSTSQIFLLISKPKPSKYRFFAGAKYRTELGFEMEAMRPYTQIFDRAMTGTPKDPIGGMVNMAKKVDEYLFDKTDPGQIAARDAAAAKAAAELAAAARLAEEAKQLITSRGALDHEIMRLEKLLSKTEHLPPDTSSYNDLHKKSKAIRLLDNKANMLEMANSMRPSVTVLDKHVSEKAAEALLNMLFWSILFLSMGITIGCIVNWRYKVAATKRKFYENLEAWKTKVRNASSQYVKFYGERDSVAGLKEITGETKELFDRVTVEVDVIYTSVSAMDAHLRSAEATAKKGKLIDLNADFEFDTGKINEADLFGKPTKTITVKPATFMADLKTRFEATIADWQRLKRAAELRFKAPEEIFTSEKFTALTELAGKHHIPERWIADHPLADNDSADALLYADLAKVRWNDPLAYQNKLEELKQKESEIEQRLNRLVSAMQLTTKNRLAVLKLEGIALDPADDPAITFDNAQREEDKLAGRLAARQKVEEIEEQAAKVNQFYILCREQIGKAENALKMFNETKARADALFIEITKLSLEAGSMSREANKRYKGCKANSFIAGGDKFVVSARHHLEKAERQLAEKRHLNARRNADEGVEALNEAKTEYKNAIKHCKALEDERAAYEKKVASMQAERTKVVQKIKGYRLSADHVPMFQPPTIGNAAVDFAELATQLALQEALWHRHEQAAHSIWQQAERARMAEVAAEAAREAAATAAARNNSYSWNSSSSSSSFSDIGSSISDAVSDIGGSVDFD